MRSHTFNKEQKLLNFTKKRIAQSELSACLLGDLGGMRRQLRVLGAKRRGTLSASIPWNSGKLRPLGAIGDAKVLAIAYPYT